MSFHFQLKTRTRGLFISRLQFSMVSSYSSCYSMLCTVLVLSLELLESCFVMNVGMDLQHHQSILAHSMNASTAFVRHSISYVIKLDNKYEHIFMLEVCKVTYRCKASVHYLFCEQNGERIKGSIGGVISRIPLSQIAYL